MPAAPVLYDGLLCLFGAVAAVERGDLLGWQLLRRDLPSYFASSNQLLTAIALATLDRLDAATDSAPAPVGKDEIEPVAHHLVSTACSYGIATRTMVRHAASNLGAITKSETLPAADITSSTHDTDDRIDGAIALLAAAVELWARRTGQSPRRAAADLCLAASYRSALP